MGSAARALRLLVATAVRADPVRAAVVLLVAPLLGVAAAGQSLGLAWLVDAAVDRRMGLAVAGAGLFTAAAVVARQVGMATADLRLVLQQRVALELDRQMMIHCAGRPYIDHHLDPAYLDRLELLRGRRAEFGDAFAAVVENLRMLVGLGSVVGVLAAAGPALLPLPLFTLPAILATRRQRRLLTAAEAQTAEQDRQRRDLFSLACDAGAAREVRLYRLAGEVAGRHRAATAAVHRARAAAATRGTTAVVAGWLVFVAAMFGGAAAVVHAVYAGSASPGQAVLVVTLAGQLTGSTGGLAGAAAWLGRALDTATLYRSVVAPAGDEREPREAPPAGPAGRGDLVLDGVSFGYPGRDEPALRRVDLRVPAGSVVAVVGDNGAGKSTLVALLAGLYRPSEGRITYAGRDLADLDPAGWRSGLGACFQDFCRFELLLREAVGLGDTAAMQDESAVLAALARAGGAELPDLLPAGLDTQLGPTFPGGTDLSAGQWQKTGLARATMRPAPALLLLDEPAARLDAGTEALLVNRYLDRLGAPAAGTITVIVSHRLVTARAADLIVLLDRGQVREVGSHAELMRRRGRYAEMHGLHAAPYLAGYR